MLRLKILPVLVLSATFLFGQDETRLIEGKVTFTTSRNVYVRFDNTADIAVGDTLRWSVDGALLPCLLKNRLYPLLIVRAIARYHRRKIR